MSSQSASPADLLSSSATGAAPTHDLVSRIAGTDDQSRVRVQALLAEIPAGAGASYWLGFGLDVLERLSTEIKICLEYGERPEIRVLSQHLSRLQAILHDVSYAMKGGLFKRSVRSVWNAHVGELRQLEEQLKLGAGHMALIADDFQRMQERGLEVQVDLTLHARVLEACLETSTPTASHGVLSRMTSFTAAQDLAQRHLLTLATEISQVQELASLVMDSVLVKLTSMYALLGSFPAKPTETERFIATEKISELSELLPRAPVGWTFRKSA